MEKSNINEVIDLWNKNHSIYCNDKVLPKFLPGGKQKMEDYFLQRINNKGAITLKDKNKILGYFSWIPFHFHNEKSVFCPIIGHSGIEDDKEIIYTQLYNYVSKEWVKNDIFNHLWMIYNKDNFLKEFSYDIGFGSYVVDACIKNGTMEEETNCQYKITRADKNDCKLLYDLAEESRHYYLNAPIFLKRKVKTQEEIKNIIENEVVFLAWDKDNLIGFMSMRKKIDYDIEQLFTPESASIDTLGAYIKSEYRSQGIGKTLLNKSLEYCNNNAIDYIHVCFETSNTYANKFWRKYFNPIILSVRRTINKDVNL
jgi:ribosomal protein S18 acetylase RimI-like enzyme